MAWPTIAQPTFGTGGDTYLPLVKSEFDGNYVQKRKRCTRERRRWTLLWEAMTEADFLLLDAAFQADQGNTFSWTEPITSTVYTVSYVEDSLVWTHSDKGHRRVQVDIEEV